MGDTFIQFLNPERYAHLLSIKDEISEMLIGDFSISHSIGVPEANVGTVSVIGREFEIKNNDVFMEFVESSGGDIVVFERVDGNMQMDITFYNMTLVIKGE